MIAQHRKLRVRTRLRNKEIKLGRRDGWKEGRRKMVLVSLSACLSSLLQYYLRSLENKKALVIICAPMAHKIQPLPVTIGLYSN